MNNADKEYSRIANKILNEGVWKNNRTGMDCLTIAGAMFEHDMADGFPLFTSRKLPFKSTKVELEFFIKGLRSKKWLQERGCNYWNQWCNPQRVAYGHGPENQAKMAEEDDLGLIYGTQWRNFADPSRPERGTDQLKKLVETLKTNPHDRRMIVSAWNPLVLSQAALPSCHYGFQVTVIGNKLNLAFNQRSVDFCCNQSVTTYALLLHLLAKESGLEEGKLIGFLMDTHCYRNHLEQLKELIQRPTFKLPIAKTDKFTSIFDWTYEDTELVSYQSGPSMKFEVSI